MSSGNIIFLITLLLIWEWNAYWNWTFGKNISWVEEKDPSVIIGTFSTISIHSVHSVHENIRNLISIFESNK